MKVSKHEYLISKYHWKSRENFIELSADSFFWFFGGKFFTSCVIPSENLFLFGRQKQLFLFFISKKKKKIEMKENEKMFYFILTLILRVKTSILISKYRWKSSKSFIKLSADSGFLFLGIGSKTKRRNWRKVFYIMCYHK